MNNIHPTAIVGENVTLGDNITIGAYAIVEDGAIIADSCIIEPSARIHGFARLGKSVKIGSFATIAGEPQDLHFDSSIPSYVEIGENTVIREGATIHRATIENASTVIGKNCLIMANAHIAHDCVLGDNIIQCPFSALGGHVKVANNVFISGGAMVHQFMRLGEGAMLSGLSSASKDVPPFVYLFERNSVRGINIIGMSRRGFSRAEISQVKSFYSKVYVGGVSPRKVALELLQTEENITNAGRIFLEFFTEENRHFVTPPKCEA